MMINSLQFCQSYKGNVNSVVFPHSQYKWDDEIIKNFNHVLNTRERFIIACHLIFSFTCYKHFLSLLMFINFAYLHSLLVYWLINIPDLTIQGMRAVKIYDLFQVFYFHFMCLQLFRRSDLGEYLKMNAEDTQKSHYTLSYLEFPLCSPHGFVFEFTVVLWSWEERFQNTLNTLSTRNANLSILSCGHTCKRKPKPPQTTNGQQNRSPDIQPWHTKNLQKRLAKIQIKPNTVTYLHARTFRVAGMKSARTFLFFRLQITWIAISWIAFICSDT